MKSCRPATPSTGLRGIALRLIAGIACLIGFLPAAEEAGALEEVRAEARRVDQAYRKTVDQVRRLEQANDVTALVSEILQETGDFLARHVAGDGKTVADQGCFEVMDSAERRIRKNGATVEAWLKQADLDPELRKGLEGFRNSHQQVLDELANQRKVAVTRRATIVELRKFCEQAGTTYSALRDLDEKQARRTIREAAARKLQQIESGVPAATVAAIDPVRPDPKPAPAPAAPPAPERPTPGNAGPSQPARDRQALDISKVDRQPVARFQARPQYPFEMRRQGIAGEVVVDFIIDPNGDVVNAYAIRSSRKEFEPAAVQAVSKWKFRPGMKDGSPVAVHLQVPLVFTLNEN